MFSVQHSHLSNDAKYAVGGRLKAFFFLQMGKKIILNPWVLDIVKSGNGISFSRPTPLNVFQITPVQKSSLLQKEFKTGIRELLDLGAIARSSEKYCLIINRKKLNGNSIFHVESSKKKNWT